MSNIWDSEWDYTVKFAGPLTTVTLEHTIFGVSARGSALCNYEDEFDEDYGEALASARAHARAYRKLEKILANTF